MKCFFPVENSDFGRSKTNLRRFQKWKRQKKKKKKKKKRSSPLLELFLLPIFHLPFHNFPSFLLNSHPFSFFPCLVFSRYISKNFPVTSLWGTLCPPPFTPLGRRVQSQTANSDWENGQISKNGGNTREKGEISIGLPNSKFLHYYSETQKSTNGSNYTSIHKPIMFRYYMYVQDKGGTQIIMRYNREDAYSRMGGIFIRDTARHTAYSLWFNEVWP